MTAISFQHVTKAYDLQSGSRTLLSSIKMITGANRDEGLFHALSDISFEIKKGEAFGIIGRNGAGKSTILKLIAGITQPTSGTIHVNGLISSLIELGAGFHPDLTGRENVYMSGAILGIPRAQIDVKFKEIVDFAELWEFIDVPVKKYSSGMYARLGFSVAISINPDILIVDEILSVGDVFFQQRCFAKMRQIVEKGTTFIFVTHDTAAMQNLCSRALLLDGGKADFLGNTAEAVSRYFAKMGEKPGKLKIPSSRAAQILDAAGPVPFTAKEILAHTILTSKHSRHGAGGIEVAAARITDAHGNDTLKVPMQGSLTISLLLRAHQDVIDPSSGLHLYNRMGTLVFAAGTRQLRHRLPDMKKGEEVIVCFDLDFTVEPGEYTFSLGASEPSGDNRPNAGFIHDRHEMLGPITVTADETEVYPFYGVAKLPMRIIYSVVKKT